MIEAKPEENEDNEDDDDDDDLFTEPADKEPKINTQNDPYDPSYSEIMPHMVADFYHGLRKYKVPRKEAGELTGMYLKFTLECVIGLGR